MFENPSEFPNCCQSGSKTSAVVSWPVMFAAPPLEVDAPEIPPQLAWRMRHHGQWP
jgi:hypothetical protein